MFDVDDDEAACCSRFRAALKVVRSRQKSEFVARDRRQLLLLSVAFFRGQSQRWFSHSVYR